MELREQELNGAINKPGNKQENEPYIKQIIRLEGNKGVIFDRNDSGSADSFRHLEAHVYVNGIAFIITAKILDLSATKYAEEKKHISMLVSPSWKQIPSPPNWQPCSL